MKNDLEYNIAKELRCLTCGNGENVADSNSEFSLRVKDIISEKVENGYNENEIISFFQEEYGDNILFNTKYDNSSYFIWMTPIIILIFGIYIIYKYRKNA